MAAAVKCAAHSTIGTTPTQTAKSDDSAHTMTSFPLTSPESSPLYPIAASVANINLDAGNLFGLTRDLSSSGYGNSTLDDVLEVAGRMQGREFERRSGDTDGGLYFGSDQLEFAKVGIPAVFPWSGIDYVGKPKDYGEKAWDKYTTDRYHKVTDEVMPDWESTGAVEDTRWFVIAGYLIAQDRLRPKWKEGSEFIWISKSKKE